MPYRDAYHRTLLEARRLYLQGLTPDMLETMYLEMAEVLLVLMETEAGTLSGERARRLMRDVERYLARLEVRLIATGDGAIMQAIDLAVGAHEEATSAAIRLASVQVSYSFAAVPDEVLEVMMVRRDLAEPFDALVRRSITQAQQVLDKQLRSAVARGVSAPEAARELAHVLAGGDPDLVRALKSVRISSTTRIAKILEGVPPTEELERARSLVQDTYRIYVTETNAAYVEADRLASLESPVVDLVRWELSGRHPVPDICNVYAEADVQGYGAGLWHPASVPPLPHPFCLCSLSHVLRKPADWDKPKRDVIEPKTLSETDVRRVLGSGKGITKRYVERQTEMANRLARMAYESTQVEV